MPARTFANESPGATHVNTGGGPSALAFVTAVKENPAMTVAIAALTLVIAVGFLSWYGEREGRLAQYAIDDYMAHDGNDLKSRVSTIEQQLAVRRELDEMKAQINQLEKRK
jgi:hypothetical protein